MYDVCSMWIVVDMDVNQMVLVFSALQSQVVLCVVVIPDEVSGVFKAVNQRTITLNLITYNAY